MPNSAKEALVKLTTLPLLAGENVSHRFILPTVANSVDLIVHLVADARGRRQVHEVLGIAGRVEAESIESGLIFRRDAGRVEAESIESGLIFRRDAGRL